MPEEAVMYPRGKPPCSLIYNIVYCGVWLMVAAPCRFRQKYAFLLDWRLSV